MDTEEEEEREEEEEKEAALAAIHPAPAVWGVASGHVGCVLRRQGSEGAAPWRLWCTRPGYEGAHGHLTRAAAAPAAAAALPAAHLHHTAIKPASGAPSHRGVFLAQMLGVESPSASIMTIRAAGESVWPQESSDIWHASEAAPGHVPTTVRVFPACPPSPDPPT